MKHVLSVLMVLLLTAALLVGCGDAQETQPATTEAPVTTAPETTAPATEPPVETTVPETTEEEVEFEGDAFSYYIAVAYPQQIDRYCTALSEKWDAEKCRENGLSDVICDYYDGKPLDNVGFTFMDMDNDGYMELFIGAVENAQENPAVFEIWTLVDGEPVMVAQADAENRYYLQYAMEDNMWSVAHEVTKEDTLSAKHYLMFYEGKFDVMQGIIYDDSTDLWYMTYDLDLDVSNDEKVDADTANAIVNSNRNLYTAIEYVPYSLY